MWTLPLFLAISIETLRSSCGAGLCLGHVSLKSADPNDDPVCVFNYLKDPRDMAEMVDAYRTGLELLMQPSFDKYRGKAVIVAANHPHETDADIVAFLRSNCGTDYHPCGTCMMGGDDVVGAVVDGQLRVRGVDGLRVIDASVMPMIPSGNLNAPTQMIALKASDFIKAGVEQLPAEAPEYDII
jgi:choline dehydrogenase